MKFKKPIIFNSKEEFISLLDKFDFDSSDNKLDGLIVDDNKFFPLDYLIENSYIKIEINHDKKKPGAPVASGADCPGRSNAADFCDAADRPRQSDRNHDG